VQEHIKKEGGLSGGSLLAHFVGPPYAHPDNVVKACVAGLLRAGRLRIQPEAGDDITAVRDAGVRDLFDKDRAFKVRRFSRPVMMTSVCLPGLVSASSSSRN